MTIEWKTNRDGTFRQYVLGGKSEHCGLPTVSISYADGSTRSRIYEDEALAHEEASRIFTYYTEHDYPPPEYTLRDLSLEFARDGRGLPA